MGKLAVAEVVEQLVARVGSILVTPRNGLLPICLISMIFASWRFEGDSAVAGGVMRNQKGKWIIGYNRFLGSCSVFEAELWGILDGLNLLIDCGLDNVMIHSNSIEVVMAIQESSTGGSNTALIRRILQLLSQTSHWNIYYIPREENQEADNLARLAHSGRQGLRMFGKPPCGELG
ncbi:hypothetical protein Gotri_007499 [Gossypium trilobum]|uniref:RNase H type-1 domain-containing protein n=1 Tax=Gossypium trilobum TaxID=34281 RepID=A0A7J9EGA1_9ROSI|nr:hypothetical protein [Gossypium trilobum]